MVAQTVKNLPAVQETQVRSLDQEDPLEKGLATHTSVLAWRIPWTEEPGRLQSMGPQELDTTEQLIHTFGDDYECLHLTEEDTEARRGALQASASPQ